MDSFKSACIYRCCCLKAGTRSARIDRTMWLKAEFPDDA
jgi:hypothetical protein